MAKAKKTTRKKSPARETKSVQQAKKQMYAVVLFAVGILLGALTFIKGERVWLGLHNFLFGIFGWSSYFLSPLMIYIAVIAAMDKPLSTIKAKIWQVMVLIVMVASAITIFRGSLPETGSIVENIVELYESGKNLTGGGISGALLAFPLLSLTGKTGASIIIVLAIFVFTMLVTGSTLISLYHYVKRPVEDIESAYVEAVERRTSAPPKPVKQEKPKAVKSSPRFDIDVDISSDSEPGSKKKQKKTEDDIEFSGFEPPEPDLPEHPVKAPAFEFTEEDKLPQDTPVEYISPMEFTPVLYENPAILAQEQPQDEPEVHMHPLELELLESEQQEEDVFGIDDILSQFEVADALSDQSEHDSQTTAPEIDSFDSEKLETEEPEQPLSTMPLIDSTEKGASPVIYRHPPLSLLKESKAPSNANITEELKTNAQRLVDTLNSFGVQTRVTDICRGPAVTRYELQPSAGVKISRITGLADDIALNLAAAGIRIEAPIPNKPAVGIEVPNKVVSIVSIREIIDSTEFDSAESTLSVALGKDIAGNITLADLGKMPHMLIAGSTGSGKSVCINSIIVSILYKSSPDEVKLLMIDPKVVELGIYNDIPHLLVPVVTEPKKAAGALSWAVTEMLKRYKTFAENSVRDLTGYNRLAESNSELQPMPKIVIIIDELADLMMAAPNEVEDSICRLAQMARAAGMHLVIATQRPSVDVITGVIKANIPSRVAFAVSSQVDSRTILDMGGAEKLLGRGDMLFFPVGASKPVRVQGCFVTDGEVEKVVDFVKTTEDVSYDETIVEEMASHVIPEKNGKDKDSGGGFDDDDEMLPDAIECVVEAGQASTSMLQRRLRLGYARAARIVDQLEEKGIVGPFEGSKPRKVLISKERWMEMKLLAPDQTETDNATV